MDLQHSSDGGLDVIPLWLRCVEDLYRVCATRHSKQRCVHEVLLELLCIKRGRHDNDLEIGPPLDNLLQQTHQDIGGQSTFVSFVENDSAVALQVVVVHRLAQQHTVCHVLHDGLRASHVLETNAVTNLLAQLHVHLVRHTFCNRHGGHTTRLCTCHHLALGLRQIVIQNELRDLCRFTGTSLTDEDQNLRLLVKLEELGALLVDGKVATGLENAEVSV